MLGRKVYLGSHIYAKYTGDGIELTFHENKIFLDNDGINRLDKFKYIIVQYVKQLQEKEKCLPTKEESPNT